MSHRELLRELLGDVSDEALDRWDAGVAAIDPPLALLAFVGEGARKATPQADRLARAAAAERFRGYANERDSGLRHVGREARAAARAEHGDGAAAVRAIWVQDVLLDELLALDDKALAQRVCEQTALALAAVECLRDPETRAAARVRAALPLTAALGVERAAMVEHEAPPPGVTSRPLLDHLSRTLGRKLSGLERRDRSRFQRDEALSAAAFARACDRVERVRHAGLLPSVRRALLHLDVAKGGDAATRRGWDDLVGDLAIHNVASARLFGERDALTHALIESHGLAGQHLRGETPRGAFAGFLDRLVPLRRRMVGELHVTEDEAVALAVECLHVVNVVDTAAVREGLLDDALLAGLEELRDWLVAKGRGDDVAARDGTLADRLVRLRGGRDREGVELALAALPTREHEALARDLASCQLWYCEAATGHLRPAAQLRVLAAACAEARRLGIDTRRAWHAQLEPLIAPLASRYRRRLVEANAPALIAASATALDQDPGVSIALRESEEATALLTLLAIYETKSSAAFHATLKALCDLYGLRKDDFDRVANEAEYLASMNAARDDKARMLELVRPGRIVEVGPGGGVVLDLLEERFPGAEIIGIDVSSEVVAALAARRRRARVIQADAFALPDHVGAESVDTVVFCSVLHEIYSYGGFRLEPVRELLRAAWRALVPRGRVVIRDGVAPPPGTRRLRFLADDARAFFELFAAQFEGFAITWRDLPDGRVELPSHHAMEFLYTYTWGPASFPYEVREQYGILTYDAYRAALVDWLDGARLVPLPADLASYLQPGYVTALAPKIALTDERDHPARWPDSNCVLVIEKSDPTR